jgi:hypothetical protein
MIYLKDTNGNPYSANLAIGPDKIPDGVTFFAQDQNGVPISCIWTLCPRGGMSAIGAGAQATTVAGHSTSYFGTLVGANNTGFTPSVTLSDVMSATFVPPPTELVKNTINCVLTASSLDGAQARSIYIEIQKKLPSF